MCMARVGPSIQHDQLDSCHGGGNSQPGHASSNLRPRDGRKVPVFGEKPAIGLGCPVAGTPAVKSVLTSLCGLVRRRDLLLKAPGLCHLPVCAQLPVRSSCYVNEEKMLRAVFIGYDNMLNRVIEHWLYGQTELAGCVWVPSQTQWLTTRKGKIDFIKKRIARRGAVKALDEALFYLLYHSTEAA